MSEKNCRNDCTTTLRFPRRPGTGSAVAHSDDCPCCSVFSRRVSQDNRPALPRFNYRIGTYGSIREFLFYQVDMTPELQNWTHREPDDPAVALLEGASILGDILTFYQEIYANEAYLRTAQWRESIEGLVRFLGYRLSPAVGGNAVFAFELKKDEPVAIPAHFPLKATLEKLPEPAEFETTQEITAYPWLNRFNLYRPLEDGDITPETTEFYIASPDQLIAPIELKEGDRLLIGEPQEGFSDEEGGGFSNAESVIVDSIREQHGRKYYTIKGSLKRSSNIADLSVYRLGRTFHHFGYDSPKKIVNTSAAVTSTATVSGTTTTTSSTIPYLDVPRWRQMNTPLNAFLQTTVQASISDVDFPIDSEVTDLPNNVPVVLQAAFTCSYIVYFIGQPIPIQTVIRMITDVRTLTMTWGGVSGTVSQLRVNEGLGSTVGEEASMRITDALIHEVTSPLFVIKRTKREISEGTGNILNFYGTAKQVQTLKGRRIMLQYPGAEPAVVNVTNVPDTFDGATEFFPQLHAITLSEDIAYSYFPNENPSVTVFGNLMDAAQGKTLPETPIGSGDATLSFQNFKLPKAPLTYHIVPENTPPETPELEIYVDGRQWTQVDSFFGHDKEEQVYIVREDADGNSWVQFGDGKTGARLTSGVNNVTALYRIGDGAYGPLKDDTKVQASAKLKNLDTIGMPSDATGGALPEDGENARNAAPGKVQSLDRIVSLKDFESEAAAIPGVAAVSVAWQLVDNIPAVVATVLMETGRSTEIAAVRDTLNSYNTQRGAGRNAIDVVTGKRMYVVVSVEYALKPTYRADLVEPSIRRALGVNYGKATRKEDQSGLFCLRHRRFGEREYASSIEGTVQKVEGVLWARTVAFAGLSDSDYPETITLPTTKVLDPIVFCDGGHILSLYHKHLLLSAVKEQGS